MPGRSYLAQLAQYLKIRLSPSFPHLKPVESRLSSSWAQTGLSSLMSKQRRDSKKTPRNHSTPSSYSTQGIWAPFNCNSEHELTKGLRESSALWVPDYWKLEGSSDTPCFIPLPPHPSPDFSSRLQSSFKRRSSSLRRPSAHNKAPPPSPIDRPAEDDPQTAEGDQRPRASPISATSVRLSILFPLALPSCRHDLS